jgi:GAF domain-containing protein
MTSREQLLIGTFVSLADTLVADFDIIDFLHTLATRSTELLDADAAGIMLADQRGVLDCFRSGLPVAHADLAAMRSAWPDFTQRMQQLGFRSAQALPMRLRDETIGALNLFRTTPGRLSATDHAIGQAMADVATVGLIQERAITAGELLATQLQAALHSRVQLEQAKGMLAQRAGMSMDLAFQLMRRYARSNNRKLGDVAASIIDGSVDDRQLRTSPRTPPGSPR